MFKTFFIKTFKQIHVSENQMYTCVEESQTYQVTSKTNGFLIK